MFPDGGDGRHHLQTIDIDYDRQWLMSPPFIGQEEFTLSIMNKIMRCGHFMDMKVKTSDSMNGEHIEFHCDGILEAFVPIGGKTEDGFEVQATDCDICRMVFDHDIRFSRDYVHREKRQRNVLWDRKGSMTIDNLRNNVKWGKKQKCQAGHQK